MNESTYRSPEWLRKFIDFEINTGSDISGNAEKKILNRKWDEAWKSIDKYLFNEFLEYSFGYTNKSDMRDEFRGDFDILKRFDSWCKIRKDEQDRRNLEEKKRKEKERKLKEEQEEINREVNNLYNKLLDDFRNNPYSDKYSTVFLNGLNKFIYNFENNEIFTIHGNTITHEIGSSRTTYTLSISHVNKFTRLANEMIKNGRNRPGNRDNRKENKKENKYSDHPKGELYQTLKDTIKLRQEQLSKIKKDDPNIDNLKNELDSTIRAFNNLKDKYKFENLVNFYNFEYKKTD